MINIQSILKPIFSFIWRKRFDMQEYKLIKVKGWRSCIMESKGGQRINGTFLFTQYKEFDRFSGIFVRKNDTCTLRERNPNDTSITEISN